MRKLIMLSSVIVPLIYSLLNEDDLSRFFSPALIDSVASKHMRVNSFVKKDMQQFSLKYTL